MLGQYLRVSGGVMSPNRGRPELSLGRCLLWDRVDEIMGRAQSVDALRAHGVGLLAALAWRAQGREVPSRLRADERDAANAATAAPLLLGHARAAYDGRLVLIRGPEVAAYYPDPALRPFKDLDLLVDDPDAAQAALLAHGFVEVGGSAPYGRIDHLGALAWPGLPLAIELHRELNEAPWLQSRGAAELLARTQPSATGVAGVLAPVPAVHALLLAVHGWGREPLRRLLDLIDVAAVLAKADYRLADEVARRWGQERLWRTTIAAVDAVLRGGGHHAALALWSRHLASARERTVLETRLARWAGPVCSLPRKDALRAATVGFATAAHRDASRPEPAARRPRLDSRR